ncbi:OmpA family protein [Roseateles koreensis]|uniref:OmpA family protein n=1 Tax=Roseateles koreensis TaxID=2987526 RepID=A0ABT5KQM3_9BURK|nr:OmpA family protein [Roseateles koreensis]MDC8785194.1 OmpA family protein [Roseateles koreensis]
MNSKLRVTKTAVASLAALLLGACASTPPSTPENLQQARDAVHAAEMNAGVRNHAPLELKKAVDTLSRAEALMAKGDTGPELNSTAYVALQQARAAVAVASAKGDETEMAGAQATREHDRAEQRTRELAQSRQQTGVAQRQTADVQSELQAKQSQLEAQQSELAALQAQKTERGMLVTLGDILFELNRADIKPHGQQSLRKLGEFLQKYPNRQVLIEGHTDSSGGSALNDALSARRAEAVKAALVNTSIGLSPARISTVGHGEHFPVADNTSASNRALNRRVEIYISDDDQPVRPRR